ncbi:MAG: pyridoxamine 5'-phosphate oxidase [Gammaproteobacteria bacterium]|nr:MAG: pyridoxamine 5'-phosphate oxidase [Gammaproteobacteria bacterium]
MDLENIRREYLSEPLSRATLLKDPFAQFSQWLEAAMHARLPDPTAMTLATVDANLQPHQRTVLLKHVDDDGFIFYTNLNSAKAKDIRQNNKVSLHFAWLPLNRQVRIEGQAKPLPTSTVIKYFIRRPRDSQIAAWVSQQSSPIDSRHFLENAFNQMKEKFRHGQVPLPDFWGGFKVIPNKFEFWQGRPNRLHDRFVYDKVDERWTIQRLAP